MRFDEFDLYKAVHDVYRTIDNPRSSTWLLDAERRHELCRIIQRTLPMDSPFHSRQMLEVWDLYGKSITVNELGQKKIELTVLTVESFGLRCFFAKRKLGDCSTQVSLDRLVPGSRGGQYVLENCMISCSFHNTQRQDRSIEEYLLSAKLEMFS